jgi:AGZA family xanthine/uracil permease-like MFS transporter
MLDNMTQLVILSSILIGVFGFPKELVLYRIIPGSAMGVLVGNLIYTAMAIRLAIRTGRSDVTAMPLGIDTPSLFAFTFGIVGPAYLATKDAQLAWQISMAAIIISGVVKLAGSFLGRRIRSAVPRAGLLGPIAAIAILLIAFFPSLKLFMNPIVGFASLGLILICIIGKIHFPGNIPGALAAVLSGIVVYYLLELTGLVDEGVKTLNQGFDLHIALPLPHLGFLGGLEGVMAYLPIAIPFALAITIGGIDVTESASAAGDEYDTREILLADGLSTLVSGLCGGVVQTTPYIGQPAYKGMGGGAGYTLMNAIFIGLGGILGYLSILVNLIPEAAMAPILVFVGLEICAQAFYATPQAHHKAVVFSFLPILAYLVLIQLNSLLSHTGQTAASLQGEMATTYQTILVLANGFIITSLLWGATLAMIIDKRLKPAAYYMGLAAFFTFFGVIHSPFENGRLFLPWAVESTIPFRFFFAYLVVVGLLLLMDRYHQSQTD